MMNTRNYLLVSIALIYGIGLQCAINMAGDVTETGNSSIVSGVLLNMDSSPAAGVEVVIFKLSDDSLEKPVAIDTLVTNSDGSFTVELEPAEYVLEMKDTSNNFAAMTMPFEVDTGETVQLPPSVLEPYASYEGIVISSYGIPGRVLLCGTQYEAAIDSKGAFTVSDIPRRLYPVLIELWDSAFTMSEMVFVKDVDLSEGSLVEPDTLYVSLSILLLDDFETSDNCNGLSAHLGGGWWDAQSDAFTDGGSKILQPVNASPLVFASAIKNGGPDHVRSLQVLYTLADTSGKEREYPFVYVGMNIGTIDSIGSKLYDLSAFDSLTFQAKGNGTLQCDFIQEGSYFFIKISANVRFALSSEWQKYTVKPGDLSIVVLNFPYDPTIYTKEDYAKYNLPHYTKRPESWEEMGGIVNMILFLGISGDEFWLDDIRLFGIPLDDLKKQ